MMNNDKEIIRFEDLFKEEIKERKVRKDPEHKKNYGYAIIIYLLVMYVFASIVYIVASQVSDLQVTYSEEERILEAVAGDTYGFALLDIIIYEEHYQNTYADYLETIKVSDFGYYLIMNPQNEHIESFFYDYDEVEESYVFNIDYLYQLLNADPSKSAWNDTGASIHFYAGSTQELPMINYELRIFEGELTTLSHFALSLINFVVYVALIPGVWYVLRVDIKLDFDTTKAMKKSIFPAIGIGYLYIIFGNIVSNFLAQILSNTFEIPQGEAINQQVIIAALRSDGVILMMIAAVLIGPIVEELVFRKSIFGLISKDNVALIVSSLIFGAIHLIGETSIESAIVNGIPYFIMGFVFGYIYIKNDRNIWIPIIVHVLSNLISIIGILIFY